MYSTQAPGESNAVAGTGTVQYLYQYMYELFEQTKGAWQLYSYNAVQAANANIF